MAFKAMLRRRAYASSPSLSIADDSPTGRLMEAIIESVDVSSASAHIVELRERKESLESTADEARFVLAERRQHIDSTDTISTFVEEMSELLATSELTETKVFVHSFVKEIHVKPGIIYSTPTPDDSPLGGADSVEIALNVGIRKSVRHRGPKCTVLRTFRLEVRLYSRGQQKCGKRLPELCAVPRLS